MEITQSLEEVVASLYKNHHLVSLDHYNKNVFNCGYTDQDSHYYKWFAVYAKLYRMKNFLELGTREGRLSRIMMDIVNTTVADINLGYFWFQDLLKSNQIHSIHINPPEACLDIPFHQFDMIFIDIEHDGINELKIHNKLIETGYKGIVFYDDIRWEQMRPFWASITQEKLETEWNSQGVGLVKYI